MLRHDMVETVGKEFLTSNIEAGEYSYVQAAGGKAQLEAKVGHPVSHFKLDIRFEMEDVVVLIETKQNYDDDDEKQLREYLEEERAIHPGKKAICILANTNNDKIKVWKSFVDDEHILKDEAMLDRIEIVKGSGYTWLYVGGIFGSLAFFLSWSFFKNCRRRIENG